MFCLGYIIHCFKDVINDLSKSTEVVFFCVWKRCSICEKNRK